MSRFGLLSLVCALTSGVFGFEADAPPAWGWQKGLFFMFLFLAAASFVGSLMSRPSLWWEVFDEIQGKRFRRRQEYSEAIRLCPIASSNKVRSGNAL